MSSRNRPRLGLMIGVSAICLSAIGSHAFAEGAAAPSAQAPKVVDEVYVTARKRVERLIDVPVAVTEISARTLDKYATTDMTQLSTEVPTLNLQRQSSGQGGNFSIRGMGSGIDVGIDQAVALNFDGIQISRARFITTALFDLQSVEVLKGPQALFFGKNSPAGLVAFTSASPGRDFDGYLKLGYVPQSLKRYVEGAVSIPVTSTLSTRLAFRYDAQDGYLHNEAAPVVDVFDCLPQAGACVHPTSPGAAQGSRVQSSSSTFGRATFDWRPNDTFEGVLKLSYGEYQDNGDVGNAQRVCAGAHPVLSQAGITAVDVNQDCKLNFNTSIGSWAKVIADHWPEQTHGGKPFSEFKPFLGSLNLSYHLGKITLTSVTGYFNSSSTNMGDSDATTFVQLAGSNDEYANAISEELRASSQFSGPVNFLAGAYFERSERRFENSGKIFPQDSYYKMDVGNGPGYDSRNGRANDWNELAHTNGTTYSVFGQVSWRITDQLTADAGARWLTEDKDADLTNTFVNDSIIGPVRDAVFLSEGHTLAAKVKADNVSPEATLTYKPQRNLTLYAAYKTGFQSGGMSNPGLAGPMLNADGLIFKPMKAHGEEVGFKFSLLAGALTGDVTAYSYDFDNLQVQSARAVEVAPGVDTVLYTITNAADAYTRGVEAQGVWRTPVPGLVLNGFLSYNDARYKNYKDAPCYTGQTEALGCFTIPGTATQATDLSNRTLPNSPTWSGRLGAAYDWKLGHGLSMGLTFDANYQSAIYLAQPASVYVNDPAHGVEAQRRGDLWLMNASARLYTDSWELALIGRNIANTIYLTSLTTALGAPSPDQLTGTIGDPLLVTLQFTYRFH